jgi:putative aminopeptidase FrvX
MLKSLIASLTEVNGPSGYEKPVRDIVKETISSYVDNLFIDQLGNLIARKGRLKSNGKRMMLTAHLDEIGLIVSHVDERGFARFTPLGSWDLQTATGSKVKFLNGQLGLIGCEGHSDNQKDVPVEKLFIDTGATSRQNCPVQVGDTAVFASDFMELGQRIIGKALDDRVGIALLMEVICQMAGQKIVSSHELYFIFSTQGQVGSRGATVAAFGVDPDLCMSIDLTTSGGTPKSPFSTLEMGKGPSIRVRDQLMLSDPQVVGWMRGTAEREKIPYQIEIREKSEKGLQNLQTIRSGIATAALSIPSRFLHSSTEMADFGDIQNALLLLLALISEPFRMEK